MKVSPRARLASAKSSGNELSTNKCYTRKKAEGKMANNFDLHNNSELIHVLADRTNSSNMKAVVSTVSVRLCHLEEHVPQESKANTRNNCLVTWKDLVPEPAAGCQRQEIYGAKENDLKENKQVQSVGKQNHKTNNTEEKIDVYDFVLDEDETKENKCKQQKSKKCRSRRQHIQKKVIDSPEEVIPAKKVRKPLTNKAPGNSVSGPSLKSVLQNPEGNLLSCKKFLHKDMVQKKAVLFSSPPPNQLLKTNVENYSTPKICRVSCTTTPEQNSAHLHTKRKTGQAVSAKKDLTMKQSEISRKLISFFSPVHNNNLVNIDDLPTSGKIPAKQPISCSSLVQEHSRADFSNDEAFLPPQPTNYLPDKTQEEPNIKNNFGFDDYDNVNMFSPEKTFTKCAHKAGAFQCSTPKASVQNADDSHPFRFPVISAIKMRKHVHSVKTSPALLPEQNGKNIYGQPHSALRGETRVPVTTATVKKNSAHSNTKTISHRNTFLRGEPCVPTTASTSVGESCVPVIFDLCDKEIVLQNKDENRYGHECQPQVTLKDDEAVPFPHKKSLMKCYGTPKNDARRLRQPLHIELKEDLSEDETEEKVRKKHKKTHKAYKVSEVDKWAKSFNSMCETVDSFELVVE